MAQLAGAISGVCITHFMFGQTILQLSSRVRADFRFLFSEMIATLGLLLVIGLSGKKHAEATPMAVATYITAAYWCTSSTSFANPAVTIARAFTNTFSGIAWPGVIGFIAAQIVGSFIALFVLRVIHLGQISDSKRCEDLERLR